MVTDAMSAKELAEMLANKSTLATSDKSVIAEPKKRGGRAKKAAEDK